MSTNLTTATDAPKRSLVSKIAERFGVDPDKLLTTLKATAFRQKPGTTISNEQMMALLVVADQYGLNPFTKELYAFEDRGAIVPIVSVDGWARIINTHRELDGVEFRYSDNVTTPPGGKPCPDWCEAVIYRKDRSQPTVVREYLDEVYRPPFAGGKPGPWQTHTKRFLRHKALIQGSRVAFGFAGIYDQDEGERIIEAQSVRIVPEREDMAQFGEKLAQRAQGVIEHQSDADDTPALESSEPTETSVLQFDPDTGELLPEELQH